jgi:hypothetical protein
MKAKVKTLTECCKISIAGLLVLACLSCKEEEKVNEIEEPVAPCNLQTEQREGMDIQNIEAKLLKEYPENIYKNSSSEHPLFFIYEKESIVTLYAVSGSLVAAYEICNFPQRVKDLVSTNNDITLVISGKVFETSRDHGVWPATYSFYDLELISLKRK